MTVRRNQSNPINCVIFRPQIKCQDARQRIPSLRRKLQRNPAHQSWLFFTSAYPISFCFVLTFPWPFTVFCLRRTRLVNNSTYQVRYRGCDISEFIQRFLSLLQLKISCSEREPFTGEKDRIFHKTTTSKTHGLRLVKCLYWNQLHNLCQLICLMRIHLCTYICIYQYTLPCISTFWRECAWLSACLLPDGIYFSPYIWSFCMVIAPRYYFFLQPVGRLSGEDELVRNWFVAFKIQ